LSEINGKTVFLNVLIGLIIGCVLILFEVITNLLMYLFGYEINLTQLTIKSIMVAIVGLFIFFIIKIRKRRKKR